MRNRKGIPMTYSALRGALCCLSQDPFLNPSDACVSYESDGIILIEDGRIRAFGPAREIRARLPARRCGIIRIRS